MKKFMKSLLLGFILVLSIAMVTQEVKAQGCVMCKSQVGDHKDKDEAKLVGASLNTGILYLMAVPYLLVGTVGFIWYRHNKKNSAQ